MEQNSYEQVCSQMVNDVKSHSSRHLPSGSNTSGESHVLGQWMGMNHDAHHQARLVRPVAPGMVDALDDDRVASFQERLIRLSYQIDLVVLQKFLSSSK